jgi:hypothetical protein
MGARQYSPLLGRFLQTDPVEGGNENEYVYPADPINHFDIDGRDGKRKKQLRKVRAGLQNQVDKHQEKVRRERAKGRDANEGRIKHWEAEIRGWKKQIGKIDVLLTIGNGPNWGSFGKVTGAIAGGGAAWWAAKLLSPACGPLAPACAVAL